MYIDKAIKREGKFRKIYLVIMVFLGFLLPIIVYLARLNSIFIYTYLSFLEILIFTSIIKNIDYYNLKFKFCNNRLKLKSGIFFRESSFLCDKIAIVHTVKSREDMEIVLVTSMKFKNRELKIITKKSLDKYPEVKHEYLRLRRIYPEQPYYIQVIKRGALNKYVLLDKIFRNCVRATYTESAVDSIKIARRQKEF